VRQIRIALAAKPDTLHHLVEQGSADQPDLAVVAVASSEVALLLDAHRADVVVVPMQCDEPPAVATRLLDEYPRIGVVCVDLDLGRGAVFRLGPNRVDVDEVSPRSIVAAIRRAADDNSAWENG
jgi:hypothetical protein